MLGFELVHTRVQDNEYTRRLVGFSDAVLRVAQLAVPGQPRGTSTHDLELVEYIRPRGVHPGRRICDPGAAHLAVAVSGAACERRVYTTNPMGAAHLAVAVSGAAATHDRLVRAGVRFVSPPNAITAGVNKGGFACHILDPDDIVLELLQPPAHRLKAIE